MAYLKIIYLYDQDGYCESVDLINHFVRKMQEKSLHIGYPDRLAHFLKNSRRFFRLKGRSSESLLADLEDFYNRNKLKY